MVFVKKFGLGLNIFLKLLKVTGYGYTYTFFIL
jgi:hypothetical protein